MSAIVSAVEGVVGSAYDYIEDAVREVWDATVWFYVEMPLAIFGIVDEDVIMVNKTSTMVFADNEIDVVNQAAVKAAMSMMETDSSFFPWYAKYTLTTKSQIRAFYRFAEQGRYTHELPTMEIRGGDIDYDAIDAALDDALGFPATRLSVNTTYPSDDIYIKNNLQASHDYLPWANTLTFAADATWIVGTIVYNVGTDDFTVNISHATEPANTITQPGYIKERSMMVTYHADADPSSEWFYWIYVLSDGTYPGIDPEASIISNLEMLPVAILKADGIDINVDKTAAEYKSVKRLLTTLEMSVDDILDNAATNASYGSVQDLFVNFAMCPSSDVEIISKALWLTFHNIIVTNGITSNTGQYNATFKEQNINNAMVWTEHSHTTGVAGVPPNGQEYYHTITVIPFILNVQAADVVLTIWKKNGTSHEKIVINHLSGMAVIAKDGYWAMVLNKLGDLQFTIPVSYFILDQLKPTEQMQLYQHILRLDTYAAEIVHLEYYETSEFMILFEFAMIVITIWSLGTASGFIAIIRQLVLQYLVMELVVYLAELTGNAEFAAIVGLVAMIALGSATGVQAFDMATAEGLLSASTEFANNLTAAYSVETQQLQEDLEDLNRTATERLDAIKEDTPEDSPITAEFLVALNKVDTMMYPAVKAQYDFDLLYNYDRIIKDYYEINLMIGVN